MVEKKPIPDWEDKYEAGSDGRIYSLRTGLPIFEEVNCRHRRLQVKLWRKQKVTTVQAQRLICVAWHGPKPEGKEVSHLNGNSLDNRPENLRWETKKENAARKIEHGLSDKGLANSRACVSKEDVLLIRQRIALQIPYAEIAKEFGISKATISRINTGQRYSEV